MDFLFFIGRAHELAYAELSAVLAARFPESTHKKVTDTTVLVSGLTVEFAVSLQSILGGTIKIVRVVEKLGDVSADDLERSCAAILSVLAAEKKKISFGVAEIGRDTLPAVKLQEIKQILEESDIKARFVEGTRQGLSASVLLHQNVEECVIFRADKEIYVGYTVAIQNIDDWTKRDRMKPASDRKHGMLPPKVARMFVNISLPAGGAKRILDPFCGTGTVPMEAMMLGIEGIGSDLRIEAVGQTQKNCEWLKVAYGLETPFRAVTADATHIDEASLAGKVDGIAAEGFLGQMTPRPGAVPNMFKGLEKLYLGAFKQWTKVLRPGSRVVIALPKITIKHTVYSLSPLVDRLEGYGYNTLLTPMIYDRPGAVTKREIFVLEYKG
jgi:tRNA G10  N-methylase Trm11